MSLNRNDLDRIRQYLLRQLSEKDEELIEQRLMSEEGFLQELESAEDELIDDYVAGELSESEHEQFEQKFVLTPDRQQNLRFATDLHKYASKKRPSWP